MPIVERLVKRSDILFSRQPVFVDDEVVGKKAHRADEVSKAVVEAAGMLFDADEGSMDRMDRVIDLANWKFNKATAAGLPASSAYQLVYMTMIPWKTADNQLVQITVETLCEAQDAAVNLMGQVWVKYA